MKMITHNYKSIDIVDFEKFDHNIFKILLKTFWDMNNSNLRKFLMKNVNWNIIYFLIFSWRKIFQFLSIEMLIL